MELFIAVLAIIAVGGIGSYVMLRNSHALTATGINVYSKSEVNSKFQTMVAANAAVRSGWTGSVSDCKPGSITSAARSAALQVTNFARELNDLVPVTAVSLTSTAQANVQRAALMQAANYDRGALSHYPPGTWRCYATNGDVTSRLSNLAAVFPETTPVNMITQMLAEPGSSNDLVGHRQWLFNPDANTFAFGVTKTSGVVQVLNLSTDSTNNDPRWVLWPSRGYFPSPLAPGYELYGLLTGSSDPKEGHWSISTLEGYNIKSASVTVTHNGVRVPITLVARTTAENRPTVVWNMPTGYSRSGTYSVTISGVISSSGARVSAYTYPVTFFDPY